MTLNKELKIFFLKVSFIAVCCLLIALSTFGQHKTEIKTFYPTPNWVKTYPTPSLKKKYDLDLVIVQNEIQYNHVTKEQYDYSLYYLNTTEGVNNISSYTFYYEQDYQTLKLHKVRIRRGDEIIDLSENIHVETTLRGEQVGSQWYDNETTVNIYFDNVQIGDLVEIAYTKVGVQPDMRGELSFRNIGARNKLIGTEYFRVLTSKDKPLFYKVINQVNPVHKKNIGEYTEIEQYRTIEKPFRAKVAPKWLLQEEAIFISSRSSWKEIVDMNLFNYQLDKPISKAVQAKVDELIKGIADKESQIKAILDYVQGEVEYLDYGRIEPKRPALVIGQNYGDCKSMTSLTVKMLEYINIEAWAVLVKIGGLDDREIDFPIIGIFDHVITEFVFEGDTLFFEATDDLEYGSIRQKYIGDFRYGLRLIKGNNALTKIEHQNHNKTVFSNVIKFERYENSGIDYNVERKVEFYGGLANESIALYHKYGTWEVWKNLIDDYVGIDWCRNGFRKDQILDTFYFNTEIPFATLHHRLIDCDHAYSNSTTDDGEKKIRIEPQPLRKWLKIESREIDRYLPLPDFNKTEHHFKICANDSVKFEADTMLIETDWIRYYKKTWKENDTIYAYYSAEILKPYVKAERYTEVQDTFLSILKRMDIFVDQDAIFWYDNEDDYRDYSFIVLILILTGIILYIGSQIRGRIRKKRRLKQLEEEVEYLNEKIKRLRKLE